MTDKKLVDVCKKLRENPQKSKREKAWLDAANDAERICSEEPKAENIGDREIWVRDSRIWRKHINDMHGDERCGFIKGLVDALSKSDYPPRAECRFWELDDILPRKECKDEMGPQACDSCEHRKKCEGEKTKKVAGVPRTRTYL